MKNKCPTCKNCVIASYQVHYAIGEGFDPIEIRPKKIVKTISWTDTYTCKFGVKECSGVQKCSHYQKKNKR